jgi:Secretion system C-terminal sorting domain/Metallo-peptidase family M12
MKKFLIISFLLLSKFSYSQDLSNQLFTIVNASTNTFTKKGKNIFSSIQQDITTQKIDFLNIKLDILGKPTIDLLLGEEKVTYKFQRKEVRNSNSYSYFYTRGDNEGQVIITYLNGDVLGNILYGTQFYEIKTLCENVFVIRKYNQTLYPDENCFKSDANNINFNAQLPIKLKETRGVFSGNIECKLRVIIAYTPAVSALVNNVPNLCQQSVDLMNQAFINSSVNHQAELAYADEVAYTENDNLEVDRDKLFSATDGVMDIIHIWKNDFSADACILFSTSTKATDGSSLCGVAKAIFSDKNHMFVSVNHTCAVNNLTFPHEITHLLGGVHNGATTNIPFSNGFGLENVSAGWRTIMALRKTATSTTRLPNFSNPNVNIGTDPSGNNIANVASVLNNTIIDARTFNSPPINLIATNYSINSNISGDHQASNKISTNGSYTIKNGGAISMRAPFEIELTGGFDSELGSYFLAENDNVNSCIGNPNAGGIANGGAVFPQRMFQPQSIITKVYPNPISNVFTIEYSNEMNQSCSIELLDISGKTISILYANNNDLLGSFTRTFNIQSYANGIYFIKLIKNNTFKFVKIQIQK